MKTTATPVRGTILLALLSIGFAAAVSKAAEAQQPAPTNSVGMTFVRVPAGRFEMGSPPTDPDATPAEKPRHAVTISKPFEIGRHEVTQAQWEAVMGSSPYTSARSNPFYGLPGMAERIRQPANPATVSWNDAQAFIAKLNQREGHRGYRLPTEAEWEYAARAGTTTIYSFGDDVRQLGTYAWFSEDFATGSTHPVGSKSPNAWGLYDVHGNAWEWVQDWYDESYYARSPATDPTGPSSGKGKVVRGGSWHVTSGSWRTAFRKSYEPDYRGISIGFRVVRDVE